MEKFINSNIVKILRYILIFPASFLLSWLASIILKLMFVTSLLPYNNLVIFINILVGGFIANGFIFVAGGATIAPNYKKFVSIVLSFFIIILYSFNFILFFIDSNQSFYNDILLKWEVVLKDIASIIGALYAIHYIWNEENNY
tara:strand:+ start:1056 stop:1484 length:429 start_codon:yes stop_codon:yes gene_type:complete